MKRMFFRALTLALSIVFVFCMSACAYAEGQSSAQGNASRGRVLVAYFSRAGENYNVGVPDPDSASASYAGYIEKGNTAILAEIIAALTGGDLFEIVPVTPYPDDYASMLALAEREASEDAMPEIAGTVERFDEYDTVLLGYPIWDGDMPRIVYHFLSSYDFAGKTVIPFNTHEGSGQAGTQRTIASLLPEATVLNGLAMRGSVAQNERDEAKEDVTRWLSELNIL